MRLSEAMDWYGKKGNDSAHYYHFQPMANDFKAKTQYQKHTIQTKHINKRIKQIDIFE